MRYFRHVWTWSWCFSLLKCLIHCCIFYGDDVVCYLRTLETHNAGVTLLERNVAADIWVSVGLAARRPSRLPQLYVRPKCDSMVMILFPCCCTRCIGLSFAWYSEKRHPVRTFGPSRKVWLPCDGNLWNAQWTSTGLTHKTYNQRFS